MGKEMGERTVDACGRANRQFERLLQDHRAPTRRLRKTGGEIIAHLTIDHSNSKIAIERMVEPQIKA